MASYINVAGLGTLQPKEVQSINDFVKQYFLDNPGLTSLFGKTNTVKTKEQIAFIQQTRLAGVSDTTCARPATMTAPTTAVKYWDPKAIGDSFTHCNADLNSLFKPYYDKISSFQERYNIDGSELMAVMTMFTINLLERSVLRHAFLGNTTLAAAGAATAGLRSGTGATIGHYNVIDGIYKQLFTYIAGAAAQRVTITENNNNTLAAQTAFASNAVLGYLDSMANAAPIYLRSRPTADQVIIATDAAWLNYRASMRTADAAIVGSNVYKDAPMSTLAYNGVPVINIGWPVGVDLNTDMQKNTGTGAAAADLPNRLLWTTWDNLQLGTLNQNDFGNLELDYSTRTRDLMIGFGYTLDAKIIDDSIVMAAY